MVMNLIMKLGKIVAALLIAAALIAAATWGITVAFDLSDTLLGNFLGPLGLASATDPNSITGVDPSSAFGDFNEGGNLTSGFGD